jgi:phosphoglycolate phosphatase-like HAD superfamily hydrolase
MLILYDIDMTLLKTDHIGIELLRRAGESTFAPGFDVSGVEFGGCLDQDIIRRMIINNKLDPTPDAILAMRRAYHRGLDAHNANPGWSTPLPGAHELVRATIAMDPAPTIGLLTGNFPETGRIKLEAAGFDPEHFTICVWGDDSPHDPPARAHLPPIALERARASGLEIDDPRDVLIIGDTIHDVSCALDNGMSVLAVATGHHTRDQLEGAGAHHVVDDLTDTQEIIAWITSRFDRSRSASASSRSMS